MTVLGFSSAPLGNLFDHLDEATSIAASLQALACGINRLNMAPLFGHGLAELRVGAALRQTLQQRSRASIAAQAGTVCELSGSVTECGVSFARRPCRFQCERRRQR